MWWKLLIFVLLLIITPFCIGYFSVCVKKKNNLTKEQEKAMNLNMFKYLLFYWLIELFFMSVLIIDNLTCKYIFGGLILLIVLYNLTMSFVSNTTKETWQRIGILQDFIAGMGLTIYLIYIIPGKQVEINGVVTVDDSLRDIITTIVAAVYGGLFTLVGVAWTIKKGDNDRKEEERKKYIPYVSFQSNSLPLDRRLDAFCVKIPRSKQDKKLYYYFDLFEIKNISSSNIIFKGIRFNNDIDIFCKKFILEKEKSLDVRIEGGLNIGIDLSAIGLLTEDMLCNTYYLKCDFQCCPFSNKWDDAESKNDNFDLDTLSCKITGIDLPVMSEGEKHE